MTHYSTPLPPRASNCRLRPPQTSSTSRRSSRRFAGGWRGSSPCLYPSRLKPSPSQSSRLPGSPPDSSHPSIGRWRWMRHLDRDAESTNSAQKGQPSAPGKYPCSLLEKVTGNVGPQGKSKRITRAQCTQRVALGEPDPGKFLRHTRVVATHIVWESQGPLSLWPELYSRSSNVWGGRIKSCCPVGPTGEQMGRGRSGEGRGIRSENLLRAYFAV